MPAKKYDVVLYSEDGRSVLKRNVIYATARKAVKTHSVCADSMMGENGLIGITAFGSEIEIVEKGAKS
jgi:hypothetical protein